MTIFTKNNARILLALLLGLALYQAFSGDFLSYLNYFTSTGNLVIFVGLVDDYDFISEILEGNGNGWSFVTLFLTLYSLFYTSYYQVGHPRLKGC